jgi:hypothetical protein
MRALAVAGLKEALKIVAEVIVENRALRRGRIAVS